jgi:death-on-curing protein
MTNNSLNTAAPLACGTRPCWSPPSPALSSNKRTAFIAIELFLALNGHALRATDQDCVMTMLPLAAGDLSEDALADWIRAWTVAT